MQDELTARAQSLRKRMTKEERWLWYQFLKDHPVQSRIHASTARRRLSAHGSGHYTDAQRWYDEKRTRILKEQYGVSVLRFTNLEIQKQFRAVCEQIDCCIAQRLPLGEAVTEGD